MKAILLTINLAVISFLSFAQSFEGVIEASTFTQASKENASVKWYVKNGNSRMEITGVADGKTTNSTLLFQKSNTQFYLLSEISGKKAAFAIPQDSISAMVKSLNMRAVKTEATKTIAGSKCYLVNLESAEGTTECWVSDEVKVAAESFPPSLRSKGILGVLKSNGITALPLDVTSRNAGGEVVYSFSIKSITPMALNESLFSLPADAEKGEELLKKSIQAE